jgi:hypothetical protein
MKGREFSDHMKTPDADKQPAAEVGQVMNEETRFACKTTLSWLDDVKTKMRAASSQLEWAC